jgi:hypothetical protein
MKDGRRFSEYVAQAEVIRLDRYRKTLVDKFMEQANFKW